MPPGSKKRKAARRKKEMPNSAADDSNDNHDQQPDSPGNPTNEETAGGGTSEEHERKEGYQSSSDHPATAGDTDDDPPKSESISSMENTVNGSTFNDGRNHAEISPEAEEVSSVELPVKVMNSGVENGKSVSEARRDVTEEEPLPEAQDVRVDYVDESSKEQKGKDYKETVDSAVLNGNSDSATSRDVTEEEPLPEAQDVRVEYVDESSKDRKDNEYKEQQLPMLVGPTDFAAGQSVPVNEEMAQAAEVQAVSTETLSTESGVMVVPLHEDEPHDIPRTAEDARGPLASHRTWWNCCGLLEVFSGSRS